MHKTRPRGWQKVPVNTRITIYRQECFYLRKKGINNLLPAESRNVVFMSHNRYDMALSKRKQIGKGDTFAANDLVTIRKCGRYGQYCIMTERAAISI